MGAFIDRTGQKFGKLTAIKYVGKSKWLCKCDCGNEKIIFVGHLTTEHTQSCGCLLNEKRQKGLCHRVHGLGKTRLYGIWKHMKQRCYNSNTCKYKDYGARGITVCDEWKNDFTKFYDWVMNNGYQDDLSIDRINNNKGYSPDNCRWVTSKQQANNRRKRKVNKKERNDD